MSFKEWRKRWTHVFQKWEWVAAERLRVSDKRELRGVEREMDMLEQDLHELTKNGIDENRAISKEEL